MTQDAITQVLARALFHAQAEIARRDEAPVGARATAAELRSCLARPLESSGVAAERVIDELVADVEGGILGSAGGRFYGWVIGGAVPAALAADWMTAVWDQNAALYCGGPAAAIVEEVSGEWLKSLLGIPALASFAFVTGCQMAHFTCLAAARTALLTAAGWPVEERGLFGAPAIHVLTSRARHGSIDRALRQLGFGTDQVVFPADEDVLTPTVLKRALEQLGGAPCIVLLQAGDINTGAFDRFAELIPIAHAAGAWVHIDGAFGLWAAASERAKHLLDGATLADSWATDGHKWLNVPYDSGFAFVANPEVHRRAMSHRASYLVHSSDARDQMDYGPEWSRRARGFSTYAAIRSLGRDGIRDIVDRCSAHARALTLRIGALPGAEVLCTSEINQGMVRFRPPDVDDPGAHNAFTDAVITGIEADGEAFFTGTTWHGMRAMRISVCNWSTTARDADRAVDCAHRAIGKAIAAVGAVVESGAR